MEDILPPLLEKINQDFDERAANSKKLKQSLELLKNKKATYFILIKSIKLVAKIIKTTFSS